MLTARTGSGEPNLGGSLMLESIAAAVIGGVSLQGGVGGIIPAILGSIFVTMLSNAMICWKSAATFSRSFLAVS